MSTITLSVAHYNNLLVNGNTGNYTTNCNLVSPDGSKLGGVDHYIKKNVKQLVTYYSNRLKRENAKKGEYVIHVGIANERFNPSANKTLKIRISIK